MYAPLLDDSRVFDRMEGESERECRARSARSMALSYVASESEYGDVLLFAAMSEALHCTIEIGSVWSADQRLHWTVSVVILGCDGSSDSEL